ncbi:hypothetical protein [Rickettsia endosymbiont of Orchestes rusci]
MALKKCRMSHSSHATTPSLIQANFSTFACAHVLLVLLAQARL